MNVVRLNLLDRDVRIGCLYDYNEAKILKEIIRIPSKDIELESYTDPLPVDITITTDISEKARLSCIGINQHLSRQLEDQKSEMNQFWFYNFLKDESFNSCNSNEVHITAYLKFARHAKSISGDFIDSNIWNYHDTGHGGTHLVEHVEYGAEFILWMHKAVDPSKETKQTVERSMRISLDNYLDNLFGGKSTPQILNKAFETVSCSFQSSITNSCLSNGSFMQCIRKIQDLTNMEENDRRNIWHPVGMRLRRIPTIAEIRVAINEYEDISCELKERNQWVTQQCHQLNESPILHRVPFLKKSLGEFQKLLEPMASEINEMIDDLLDKHYSRKQYVLIADPYRNLLDCAFHWLKTCHEDVEIMELLLDGNSLPVLDLRSIKKKIKEHQDVKRTKVFVLHFRCITADLGKRYEKWARNPKKGLNVFNSDGWGDTDWERISKEFQAFSNEALYPVDNDVDYAVGILSPSSPYKEGTVVSISYQEILRAVNCTPSDMCLSTTPHLASSGDLKGIEQDCDVEMI